MKNLYENPEVKFLNFEFANVITTSTACNDDCSDDSYEPSFGLGNCV